MSVRVFLLSIIATILLSVSAAYAAAGSPVAHSHDGRSHTHPLPVTGKNHTHGKKPAPKAEPSVPSADRWSAYNIYRRPMDENGIAGWKPTKQGWVRVSTGQTVSYRFKHSSQFIENNYIGVVAQVDTRLYSTDKNVSTKTIKVLVKVSDCKAKIGTVKIRDLSGNLRSSTDFVENGSNIADGLGHATCLSHGLWK